MNLYDNVFNIVSDIFEIKIKQYINTIFSLHKNIIVDDNLLLSLWNLVTLIKSPRSNAIILSISSDVNIDFREMVILITKSIFDVKLREFQQKIIETIELNIITLNDIWISLNDNENLSMSIFNSVKWCIVKNVFTELSDKIYIGISEHIQISIRTGYKKPHKIIKLWEEKTLQIKTKVDFHNNFYREMARCLCLEIMKFMITFKATVKTKYDLDLDYENVIFPSLKYY